MFAVNLYASPDRAQDLDSLAYTVRLVRPAEGRSWLVAIRCAHPWVLRKPVLVPEDVD